MPSALPAAGRGYGQAGAPAAARRDRVLSRSGDVSRSRSRRRERGRPPCLWRGVGVDGAGDAQLACGPVQGSEAGMPSSQLRLSPASMPSGCVAATAPPPPLTAPCPHLHRAPAGSRRHWLPRTTSAWATSGRGAPPWPPPLATSCSWAWAGARWMVRRWVAGKAAAGARRASRAAPCLPASSAVSGAAAQPGAARVDRCVLTGSTHA